MCSWEEINLWYEPTAPAKAPLLNEPCCILIMPAWDTRGNVGAAFGEVGEDGDAGSFGVVRMVRVVRVV